LKIPDSVVVAAIAGIVSLVVATLAQAVAVVLARRQRTLGELQLQRHLTEKLYDLRLQRYTDAFVATDRLKAQSILERGQAPGHFAGVSRDLEAWFSSAALVVSPTSLKAYYELRDALSAVSALPCSDNDLMRVWAAKYALRQSLRDDVKLLYAEEAPPHTAAA